MKRKILICGLPGSGKTTLAVTLAHMLGAVVFDGDAVRAMSDDWGFDEFDRLKQAQRMSWLCDQVIASGGTAIASFVCSTPETREVFLPDFTVFCDRIVASAYPDTNKIWVAPSHADYTVPPEGSAFVHASRIVQLLRPTFNPEAPTAQNPNGSDETIGRLFSHRDETQLTGQKGNLVQIIGVGGK